MSPQRSAGDGQIDSPFSRGKAEHVEKLDTITEDIYDADENMSDLAERSLNLAAK